MHYPDVVNQIVGALSSTTSLAKNAVDLAKTSSNRELKSAVSEVVGKLGDVQAQVLDLANDNQHLRKENERLTDLLKAKQAVVRDATFGYWYKDGEHDPLCPRCFEGNQQTVYLSPLREMGSYMSRVCNVCAFRSNERQADSNGPSFVIGHSSISEQAKPYPR